MIIVVYVMAAAWGCLAIVSLVTDGTVMYRTLAGHYGETALALFKDAASRHGGVRRWVVTCLVGDIFEPWLIWYGLLSARQASG